MKTKPKNIIGVGVDVVELSRAKELLRHFDPRHEDGKRGLFRFFTPREVAQFQKSPSSAKRFAEGFAVKESVIKAVPGLTGWAAAWNEIEFVKDKKGRWVVDFSGALRKKLHSLGHADTEIAFNKRNDVIVATVILYSR